MIAPLVLTTFQRYAAFDQAEQVHRQALGLTGRNASAVRTVSLLICWQLANVASDDPFRIVLGDFGLSKSTMTANHSNMLLTTFCGSLACAAPLHQRCRHLVRGRHGHTSLPQPFRSSTHPGKADGTTKYEGRANRALLSWKAAWSWGAPKWRDHSTPLTADERAHCIKTQKMSVRY